ncbi:BACON domain-containing protein, partial [Streptomyces sp. NPDC004561]
GPDAIGGDTAGGYENAGNASVKPRAHLGRDGRPDVSVEVVSVAGAGAKGAGHLAVGAANDGDTTLITLTASGSAPVRWSAATTTGWLYLSQSSGTLRPGEQATIKVYVDHLREPAGHWHAQVAIAPAGAVVTIDGYGTAPTRPSSPPSSAGPAPTPSGTPSTDPPASRPPSPTDPPSGTPDPPPTGSATPPPTPSGDGTPSPSGS